MKHILVLAIVFSASSAFASSGPVDPTGYVVAHRDTWHDDGAANRTRAIAPHASMRPDAAPRNPSNDWPNYLLLG